MTIKYAGDILYLNQLTEPVEQSDSDMLYTFMGLTKIASKKVNLYYTDKTNWGTQYNTDDVLHIIAKNDMYENIYRDDFFLKELPENKRIFSLDELVINNIKLSPSNEEVNIIRLNQPAVVDKSFKFVHLNPNFITDSDTEIIAETCYFVKNTPNDMGDWIPRSEIFSNESNYLVDDPNDPICFSSILNLSFSVKLEVIGNVSSIDYEYSYDKKTWLHYNINNLLTIDGSNGYKVFFRGSHGVQNESNYIHFVVNIIDTDLEFVTLSGNINTLLQKVPTDLDDISTYPYAFTHLFEGNKIVPSNLSLPSSILSEGCYSYMFNNLTSDWSNFFEFGRCLTLSHILQLAPFCFKNMFSNCTNLKSIPFLRLPSSYNEESCCESMFENCTNLVGCYDVYTLVGHEFDFDFPNTQLAKNCYRRMFYNCPSLRINYNLPSEMLYEGCYEEMFSGCRSLTSVNIGALDLGIKGYYTKDWLNNVADTGAIICSTNLHWDVGSSGLPKNWDIITYEEEEYPLCFTNINEQGNSTVSFNRDCEISFTGLYNDWIPYTSDTIIELPNVNSNKVYFRGEFFNDDSDNKRFTLTGLLKASGSIKSLIHKENFKYITKLVLTNLIGLFENCTSLVEPPEIEIYDLLIPLNNLFSGCTSLVKTPNLKCSVFKMLSYMEMFKGCTSLTDTCTLLTKNNYITTDLNFVYRNMFEGCTSLTKSPIIHLTYKSPLETYRMFWNCSSLSEVTCLSDIPYTLAAPTYWLYNVAPTGILYHKPGVEWTSSHLPNGWTVSELPDPICFTNINSSSSTVKLTYTGTLSSFDYEYSNDAKSWLPYTRNSVITLTNQNDKVYFRGNSVTQSASNHIQFVMTGYIDASGNIMSLLTKDNYSVNETVPTHGFHGLFEDCTSLHSTPNMPATTVGEYGYTNMYKGCTSLENVSVIEATTLNDACFSGMFTNCTSLEIAPDLPVTEIKDYCYSGMFSGCTSLIKAPELPASVLGSNSYRNMFYNCEKLNELTCLAINKSASNCLTEWLSGVATIGTLHVKNNILWLNNINVPEGWIIQGETNYNVLYLDPTYDLSKTYTVGRNDGSHELYGIDKGKVLSSFTLIRKNGMYFDGVFWNTTNTIDAFYIKKSTISGIPYVSVVNRGGVKDIIISAVCWLD